MKKTFIIIFTAKDDNGNIIQDKDGLVIERKIRVKNMTTSIEAQCKFEVYLTKKYEYFKTLIVHECKEQKPLTDKSFDEIFSQFDDIFGKGFYDKMKNDKPKTKFTDYFK